MKTKHSVNSICTNDENSAIIKDQEQKIKILSAQMNAISTRMYNLESLTFNEMFEA